MTLGTLTCALITAGLLLSPLYAQAEQQAMAMSLAADPHIKEREQVIEAINHKKACAVAGIPYEVGEAYAKAQANFASQEGLAERAAAAQRWMVASLADFSAGAEKADKAAEAPKNHVLIQTEYLRTVNDYNMNVAQLARLTGELK